MNKLIKRGRNGLVGVTAVAALVLAPAFAASAAVVPTVGSTHPVYLISDLDGTQIPPGSVLNWGDSVLASPEPSDEDYNSHYVSPAGTSEIRAFISPRGQEKNPNVWNAYGSIGYLAKVQLANLMLSGNTSVGQGTPSGTIAVAMAGGDYSLGLAFFNGMQVIEADYTYITVVGNANPNLATWTFDTPAAAATAPAMTTQPTSTSVLVGANATFTAAASGTPAPTVQWQSAPSASSTFTDIAGATSATLTVNNAQVANTGTQYRAVFTNSAGSVTSNIAVMTVNSTVPNEPSGSDTGKLTSPTLTEGQASFTLTGTGIAAGTYSVWAWSTPTQLPNATVASNGDVTINIAGLAPGAHTIALTAVNSATVIGWVTFTIPAPTFPLVSNTDLTVDVTTTNKFALEGVATAVNLGSAARGASTSATLPAFTVTDDRNLLPGWDLTSKVDDFVNAAAGNDTIDKAALTVEPRKVGGTIAGIAAQSSYVAGASNLFATGAANSSTPSTGTQFDAKLTFAVPTTAKAGTYTSKLTLTLASK
ncbi:MAG: hypothetical protein DI534_06180 [Leifsonia xyli]|nr:MAG: hypothetical protein DI534_06180 [Leifsonia xyli]